MSQEKQILLHLLEGNSITPIDALQRFGCFRLGARIYDIGNKYPDLKIRSDLKEVGAGKRVAVYRITEFDLFTDGLRRKLAEAGG